MRHIIPGRGIPPRCVATPSNMSDILGRRALRSRRRAPGLMQPTTLPGDEPAMKDPTLFGYHRCYLRIDVSRGSVERVPIPEAVLRQFLGGSGLGAWLLLEEGDPAIDPLAPDAPLVF